MNAHNEQPASVVVIDQSTIYNLLLEVRDDVRDVKKDLAELAHDSRDHEDRLRTLEKGDPRIPALQQRVWIMSGAAGVVGTLVGYFLPGLIR